MNLKKKKDIIEILNWISFFLLFIMDIIAALVGVLAFGAQITIIFATIAALIIIFCSACNIDTKSTAKEVRNAIWLNIISFFLTFVILSIILIQNWNFSFLISWPALIIFFIMLEVFFWCVDKKKPKRNESKLEFVAVRKLLNGLYSLLLICGIAYLYNIFASIEGVWAEISWMKILTVIGYISAAIIGAGIVIAIILGYLKLNALKYKR